MRRTKQLISFLLVLVVTVFDCAAPAWGGRSQQALRIIVLQGDGGINDTRTRSETSFAVQVQGAGGPIVGARVVFQAPDSGASGVFSNRTKTITITTDASGIAEVKGFRPNNVSGRFEITVSVENAEGKTSIRQTNVALKGGSGKRWLAITLAAGGALAAAFATRGGGNPSTSSTVPGGTAVPPTITAGNPSLGGPR